jgi:hypothetical protein
MSTPGHFLQFALGADGTKILDAFEGWAISRELSGGRPLRDDDEINAATEAFMAGVTYGAEQFAQFLPPAQSGA